ncbi:hypothetical protein PY093_06425 [Cytobacillus sp. S13-E01]|nr:hypothetical protein [Cytobacillus sp. S13-E01]MDF0726350.1 hypothetical protein [Cytobacillus sp. S13-E01]
MGCCNPNYRKAVNDSEQKINAKGKDTLPKGIKLLIVVVLVITLTIIITT